MKKTPVGEPLPQPRDPPAPRAAQPQVRTGDGPPCPQCGALRPRAAPRRPRAGGGTAQAVLAGLWGAQRTRPRSLLSRTGRSVWVGTGSDSPLTSVAPSRARTSRARKGSSPRPAVQKNCPASADDILPRRGLCGGAASGAVPRQRTGRERDLKAHFFCIVSYVLFYLAFSYPTSTCCLCRTKAFSIRKLTKYLLHNCSAGRAQALAMALSIRNFRTLRLFEQTVMRYLYVMLNAVYTYFFKKYFTFPQLRTGF